MIKLANENNGLVAQLQVLIRDEINRLPKTVRCTVKKAYPDNEHVDVVLDGGGIVNYVEFIGTNRLDAKGILIFLNQDISQYLVITDVFPDLMELKKQVENL